MIRIQNNYLLLACLLLTAASCKTLHTNTAASAIGRLQFINEFDIPYNFQYKNTTVGGLSSIDYDAGRNQYYCICDDRSAVNPARYYTVKIAIGSKGIDSVHFADAATLLQAGGQPFPDHRKDPAHACDPEALRYNAKENVYVWSSEGERLVRPADTVLTDPSITAMQKNGTYRYSFSLPANMHMHAAQSGPRRNGVFEGLAFSGDYQSLYVSVEEPIYEDGPRAGTGDSAAWTRIIRYNVATRLPLAQYAYRIDPVAHLPEPPGEFVINGVADILFVDRQHLLVTERSFSTGHLNCTIKLYLASLGHAADITHTTLQQQPVRAITKKLLLNMDSLNMYVDNVEGATFGPTLPNGHKTLVLVTDNNFDPKEKTQFFLFEIIP